VVCRQDSQPRNGDVVVAIVDGSEATLKRFYKEKNHIRLQPANDNFQPIITRDCQVRGVVVGLIRKI
jgi:repressor LexA